jgi:uncharacterized RDD family membrane protein YckC
MLENLYIGHSDFYLDSKKRAMKTRANLTVRVIAAIIDYGLNTALYIWVTYTYGVPNGEGGYELRDIPTVLLLVAFWVIYFPVTESITGRTLGKRILGLRVVSTRGPRMTFLQGVKRRLLDFVDFYFLGLVGFITIKVTADRQRLGDLWAKTLVVSDGVRCPHCRAELSLSAEEVKEQKFVCPVCNRANRS